ncbi:MAG: hypothetical protein ACI9KE_000234 [Polyangiales bacterium]
MSATGCEVRLCPIRPDHGGRPRGYRLACNWYASCIGHVAEKANMYTEQAHLLTHDIQSVHEKLTSPARSGARPSEADAKADQ